MRCGPSCPHWDRWSDRPGDKLYHKGRCHHPLAANDASTHWTSTTEGGKCFRRDPAPTLFEEER